VLPHWKNSPQVDMLIHSGQSLSWFRANHSLLLLLNAVCLTEKQQISILKSLVLSDLSLKPWSTTLKVSMLTIMPHRLFLRKLFFVRFNKNHEEPYILIFLLCCNWISKNNWYNADFSLKKLPIQFSHSKFFFATSFVAIINNGND
jgi:hypothetical protein